MLEVSGGDPTKIPPIIMLQLDNTSSQNKNNIMTQFQAALVELGLVRQVWMNFLPKGHTHCDVDQFFSVVSRALEARGPRSIKEMLRILMAIKPGEYGSKPSAGKILPFIIEKCIDWEV